MKTLLHTVLAMTLGCNLLATDPPHIGKVITSQLIDAVTVIQFHEHGISIAVLDVETMQVNQSIIPNKPPTFTTTYTDTSGNTQTVSTTATGVSQAAILTAIKTHRKALAILQSHYPPMP
jgi:hypothetical protein